MNDVAADAWVNAASIRSKMHPAEKDPSEIVVEVAENAEECQKRVVNIRKFDRL